MTTVHNGEILTRCCGISESLIFSGSSEMHVHNLHTSPSTVVDTTAASKSSSGNSTNHALSLRISRSTVVDTIAVSKSSKAGYRASS